MKCVIIICIFTILACLRYRIDTWSGTKDRQQLRQSKDSLTRVDDELLWCWTTSVIKAFHRSRGWCRHRPWMSENEVKISAFFKTSVLGIWNAKLSFFTPHTTTSVLKARLNVCRPRLTDYHVMPLSDLWWLFSLHPVGPFRTSINIFPSDMVGRKCSSKKKKKNVFVLSLTAHYSQRHLSFPRAKATSKPFFVVVFFYRMLFVRNSSFNVLMCSLWRRMNPGI